MSARNASLDGMRVVAAGVVVLVHVTAMQVTRGAPDLLVRLLNGLSAWGVPFFMPVSGYLLMENRTRLEV